MTVAGFTGHAPIGCLWSSATTPPAWPGAFFDGLQKLIRLRKENPAFSGNVNSILNTGNPHVLAYLRPYENRRLLVFANFSETLQSLPGNLLRLYGLGYSFKDLLTGQPLELTDLSLPAYDFRCLIA